MKVLWLNNGVLPKVAADMNISSGVNEGWLVGLSNKLLHRSNIELKVVFPQNVSDELIEGKVDDLEYYGYPIIGSKTTYNSGLKDMFKRVIELSGPDLVHIMGSEYPHCWSMMEALQEYNLDNKAVISIQGLVSIYASHLEQGIPSLFLNKFNIRDFIKKDDIKHLIKDFEKRGEYEVKALKAAHHVIGRTDWDLACAKKINPELCYHFNNETLRPAFYSGCWELKNCEKHSIFISQATYPVKGFHYLLEALPIIRKSFPDVKVYVGAYKRYDKFNSKPMFLNSQYDRYICKLIEENNLQDCIYYCGSLNEEQMKERFLKSHVFVSPSTIENSPNSVGEAMILGVPTVSSHVGGVANMLTHGSEGYIYQADAPYMLAYYVSKIFEDNQLAIQFSNAAKKHAAITHDGEANLNQLIAIYESIINV